jgi:predicted DsbA family dithiol-disulfide isomerase
MLIEIYSDVVCPWCYIGKSRLEQALAQRPDLEVERRWQPFQLRPEMPESGVPWQDFVQQKFGGPERAAPIFERVTTVGAADGLDIHFERITRAPNTRDAHRLILFAKERGGEWEMVDALFRAHFTEGRDLNNHEQLASLAADAGLDRAEVEDFLAGNAEAAEVEAGQGEANRHGIEGVPFYIFGHRYAISGAQLVEVFLQALDVASGASVA